jgi:hypothetical protein
MQALPGWSAGAAGWLTGTFQPVFWLTAATIWGTAADRQSAKARGDLATPWESREFPRRCLSLRPRAACHTSRWPGSHANPKVRTHELGAASSHQIVEEMTRGEIVPNTIRPLGSVSAVAVLGWRGDRDSFGWSCNEVCQRSPSETRAGHDALGVERTGVRDSRSTAIAIRHLRSLLSHSPRRPRLPVDGECQEAVSASVAEPKGERAPVRVSVPGGRLGRASSRSSSAAPIIQSSSINRRTVCISVIGRESHRGG